MSTLPIREVARQTGLSASAIRYYEAEGLLSAPRRSSGWRAFQPDDIARLSVIRIAREMGFTLSDIRTLLDGFDASTPPNERWQELARKKLPELDALMQRAGAMKQLLEKGLRCDCVTVSDCVLYDCQPPVTLTRRPPQRPAS